MEDQFPEPSVWRSAVCEQDNQRRGREVTDREPGGYSRFMVLYPSVAHFSWRFRDTTDRECTGTGTQRNRRSSKPWSTQKMMTSRTDVVREGPQPVRLSEEIRRSGSRRQPSQLMCFLMPCNYFSSKFHAASFFQFGIYSKSVPNPILKPIPKLQKP